MRPKDKIDEHHIMSHKVEITSNSEISGLFETRKEIKIDSVKCQVNVDWKDFPGASPKKRPRLDED